METFRVPKHNRKNIAPATVNAALIKKKGEYPKVSMMRPPKKDVDEKQSPVAIAVAPDITGRQWAETSSIWYTLITGIIMLHKAVVNI